MRKALAKAVVVLSSGLDSAVNLAWGSRTFDLVSAVTFDYGQRARKQEIKGAKALSKHYHTPHHVIPLPHLAEWTGTSLVKTAKALPHHSIKTLDDKKKATRSARAVWVPNRNGIFINMAGALAESLGARILIVGFNEEEGVTFPDNSAPFVNAINQSLSYSTLNQVEVRCRTLTMNKKEIVRLGIELKLPFHLIWSCYEGNKTMCGTCESCLRLKRAAERVAPALLEVFSFAN